MAFVFSNEDHANVCCYEWQSLLRLQDWDIKVEITRRDKVGEHKTGQLYYFATQNVAYIYLLNPVDFCAIDYPVDQELSLVHELIHLRLLGMDYRKGLPDYEEKTNDFNVEEIAVEMIARALVSLKRSGADMRQAMDGVRRMTIWQSQPVNS